MIKKDEMPPGGSEWILVDEINKRIEEKPTSITRRIDQSISEAASFANLKTFKQYVDAKHAKPGTLFVLETTNGLTKTTIEFIIGNSLEAESPDAFRNHMLALRAKYGDWTVITFKNLLEVKNNLMPMYPFTR